MANLLSPSFAIRADGERIIAGLSPQSNGDTTLILNCPIANHRCGRMVPPGLQCVDGEAAGAAPGRLGAAYASRAKAVAAAVVEQPKSPQIDWMRRRSARVSGMAKVLLDCNKMRKIQHLLINPLDCCVLALCSVPVGI